MKIKSKMFEVEVVEKDGEPVVLFSFNEDRMLIPTRPVETKQRILRGNEKQAAVDFLKRVIKDVEGIIREVLYEDQNRKIN